MHLQNLFLALISITYSASASFFNEIPLLTAKTDNCDCHGTKDAGKAGAAYVCGDKRLGPKVLPKTLPLLSLVSDYDRFGGDTPGCFLHKYTWPNGTWKYPPNNGFQLDIHNQPINGTMILLPGTKVDRFGKENGSYVSAADAPYSQRSLPPDSLDIYPKEPNYPYAYHIYTVIKPLQCLGGPIAPFYGQPGGGAQFKVGNIPKLLANKYLKEENLSTIVVGPGPGGDCGL